jgi:hypothetical protein
MDAVESCLDGMPGDGCILTLALLVPVSNWMFWAHIHEDADCQEEATAALVFCMAGSVIFLVRQCLDSVYLQSCCCCVDDWCCIRNLKRNFRPSGYFGLAQFTYDTGYKGMHHDAYSETCTGCHGVCYLCASLFSGVPHVVLSALVLFKQPGDVYAAANCAISACGILLFYRGLQHVRGKELYPDVTDPWKWVGLSTLEQGRGGLSEDRTFAPPQSATVHDYDLLP